MRGTVTYPSYDPLLIRLFPSRSENSRPVTPLAGGAVTFPFLDVAFLVSCDFGITIAGLHSVLSEVCRKRRSQTQIVPSLLPEHSISPSLVGSQATHLTVLVWCVRRIVGVISLCDTVEMQSDLSAETVASCVSSRDH